MDIFLHKISKRSQETKNVREKIYSSLGRVRQAAKRIKMHFLFLFLPFFFFFFVFLPFLGPLPWHMGGFQARGQIRVATYTTAHGSARSLTYWARAGIEPSTSWFLVGFVNHCATTGTPPEVRFCRWYGKLTLRPCGHWGPPSILPQPSFPTIILCFSSLLPWGGVHLSSEQLNKHYPEPSSCHVLEWQVWERSLALGAHTGHQDTESVGNIKCYVSRVQGC